MDLIERQAAISELMKWVDEHKDGSFGGCLFHWTGIKAMLECLPSAQSWIPVSERLPENLEEVNVTWVNRDPEPYYDFIKDKPATASAVYYKGEWYWYSSVCGDILAEYGKNDTDKVDDAIEIIAWMPLPKPYRAERRTDGN